MTTTRSISPHRNVMEAMEWLLEQGSIEEGEGDCIFGNTRTDAGDSNPSLAAATASTDSSSTTTTTVTPTSVSSSSAASAISPTNFTQVNNDVPQDPAQKILNTFLQYRKKWFQVCHQLS